MWLKKLDELISMRGKNCHLCGEETVFPHIKNCGKNATRDHIVPKNHNGSNQTSNLNIACVSCNNVRGDDAIEDFYNKISPMIRDKDGWWRSMTSTIPNKKAINDQFYILRRTLSGVINYNISPFDIDPQNLPEKYRGLFIEYIKIVYSNLKPERKKKYAHIENY